MMIPNNLAIKPKSYSREIAEKITGPFNQSHVILLVAKAGKGKSWQALRLCYNVARWIAKIKGGIWQDYFNLDHVAVITAEELKRVVSSMEQYGCYVFDDIGTAWKSRKYMSSINLALNDIFTTWRTDNTFVVCTIQESFLLDKVPRSLSDEFSELEMSVFEKGLTISKVFEVTRRPREQKTYYVYPYQMHTQFVRLVVKKPPQELTIPYEEKRRRIAHELKLQKLKEFGDVNESEREKPMSKKEQIIQKLKEGKDKYTIRDEVKCSMRHIREVVSEIN